MKTRAFIRIWAPLATALLFAAAFLALHFIMEPRENAAAAAELNALLDTAEARAAAEQEKLAVFNEDADAAAIHKARTVMRFLAHDDTLLETDALGVLCELLDCKAITVADSEGTVIAASDATLIGTGYSSDVALSWTMALLDDGAAPMAQNAVGEDIMRIAGVQRTDIDGYVLVWDEYGALMSVQKTAGLAGAIENLSLFGDEVMLVETVGKSGTFLQSGNLYVQRSEGDVTLIAYRSLERVHAVQNAVLIALAIFAGVALAALFCWQLLSMRADQQIAALHSESVGETDFLPEGEDDEYLLALPDGVSDESEFPDPEEASPEDEDDEPVRERKHKKRRRLLDFLSGPDVDAEDDWPDEEDGEETEADDEALPIETPADDGDGEAEEIFEPEPVRPVKTPRNLRRKGRTAKSEPDHETPFDKIIE